MLRINRLDSIIYTTEGIEPIRAQFTSKLANPHFIARFFLLHL